MYMNHMISIGKVENGFVLECQVPLKPEAKTTSKMDMCCCSPSRSSCEKQYIAKDAAEIASLVNEIMPLLDMDFKKEEDFDKAFSEAMGMMDKEDSMEEGKAKSKGMGGM